ncbi:MAG: NADP-dependent phosphogluconate dehydrogenase [Deltaproteobacteria bacterium]|nr:NADP-dependent phosphogluconate dehydrogenase [Deltaproteobacteria bacterium]
MTDRSCDIGLVGLGVMGKNFALNMADKGFHVAVYNRTEEKTRLFMSDEAGHRSIEAGYTLEEFIGILKKPRAILLFVPAGDAVDEVISELVRNLESGDLIIDCGNSHFKDTDRREESLSKEGVLFLGMGVSGGESGARHGPSLMPGGPKEAFERVRTILEPSAARVKGEPCVAYLGPRSSGHYVKMVHNGIEYGIIQLIAESYDLLRRGLGFDIEHLQSIYEEWNAGILDSYLIEITARILGQKDGKSGNPLLDMILDRARQKGTGKWTSRDALDLQVPVPTIDIAVAMRNMSDYASERRKAGAALRGPSNSFTGIREIFIQELEKALFAAVLLTYAQGMSLLRRASLTYEYDLDMEAVARIWRGGCIIRAALLEDIRHAFRMQPDLENLTLSPEIGERLLQAQEHLRSVVCTGVELGIPVPGFMSALAYYDSYRSIRLPANLIMAQRDYFGAHRYERTDAEGTFHTDWES